MIKHSAFQNSFQFLAFGFGFGTFEKAPGTWGTIPGCILFWLLADLSLSYYLFIVLLAFIGGIWLCHHVSIELKVHDYKGIVWDEIVGVMLTLAGSSPSFSHIFVGFLCFRLFDITKPWPISLCDKHVKGGLGIMLDDVLAAIPAFALFHIIIFWV